MRRRYIVDRKFQWTIVAYTFVISILTTVANLTVSRLEAFDNLQMQSGMGGAWSGTHVFTAILLAFLYIAIFIIGVLFSNRLAGPLYRLRRHMEDVAAKKPVKTVHFRKDDYFAELNGAYNKLVESLPADRKQKGGGFTIIELMVAVGIAMVLAMIAAAGFTGVTQASLLFRQDVDRMQGILMTARNSAMSKNECAVVTVVNPQTVQINTYPAAAPCAAPFPPTDFQQTQTFNAGTTVANFSTGPAMAFKPGGGTTLTAPITVRLSNGNLSNLFTIYSAIGQVRHL